MSLARITCPLYAAAQTWGEAPALLENGAAVGFATLDRQVQGLTASLRDQGVSEYQRLVVISEDKGLAVRLLLACLRLGACCIPVNARFPGPQLRSQLCRSVAHWVVDPAGLAGEAGGARTLRLPGLDPLEPGACGAAPILDPERSLTGVFTSGSSGTPKLALHSYANHRASAEGSGALIPLGPGDRWALTLPLYHIGGLAIIFRCLLGGACLQIPAAGQSLDQLLAPGTPVPTHLSAVATQLVRLQAEGVELATRGLRCLLLGGSAFPASLLDWLAPQSVEVLISYGLTEMSSQVMTGPLNGDSRLARLLPRRELTLAADGEILVRGETLFLGYFDAGRLTRPLDGAGWFHTRDLGVLDPEGGLRVRGRCDNQFISGGENIQPEEVETVMGGFAGVREAYVVPVADAEYGQRPAAFVAWDGEPDTAALTAWLRARLPGYKVPVAVLALTDAERSEGLKVSRRHLAEQAARRLGVNG